MESAMAVMALGGDYDASRAMGLMAKMAKIGGVQAVDFNYTTNKVIVNFDPARVSLDKVKNVVTRERRHPIHSGKRPSQSWTAGDSA